MLNIEQGKSTFNFFPNNFRLNYLMPSILWFYNVKKNIHDVPYDLRLSAALAICTEEEFMFTPSDIFIKKSPMEAFYNYMINVEESIHNPLKKDLNLGQELLNSMEKQFMNYMDIELENRIEEAREKYEKNKK